MNRIIVADEQEDYNVLLQQHGLLSSKKGGYLQVGTILERDLWILEAGVIMNQIDEFIPLIVGFLRKQNVAFSIPVSRALAVQVSKSETGYAQTGKMVIVYPASDKEASRLAQNLIQITQKFRAPDIPTSSWLGGAIFTRYEIFSCGEAVVPFKMPANIKWPFDSIAKPEKVPSGKLILNNKYQIESLVKPNAKGDAFRAIYRKGLRLSKCFIKQGRRNTFLDETGRDIRDRLRWQYKLLNELNGMLGIPKAIDLFEDGKSMYLVTEWIEGASLSQALTATAGAMQDEFVPADFIIRRLNWLQQIVQLIDRLHKKSYVHRDIMPDNFLVTDAGIYMIDLELVYNIDRREPVPPFQLGTPGFISPAQEAGVTPCFEDDIYALGAIFLLFFSGLTPIHLDFGEKRKVLETLCFFVADVEMAALIYSCLDHIPAKRPSLKKIEEELLDYTDRVRLFKSRRSVPNKNLDRMLMDAIEQVIKTYSGETLCDSKGIWRSKIRNRSFVGYTGRDFVRTVYPAWSDGVAGVTFMVARLNGLGVASIDILAACKRNLLFLTDYLADKKAQTSDLGLYTGNAGIAIALAECMRWGLLSKTDELIVGLFNLLNKPSAGVDLANGVAGQGLAILHCLNYLPEKQTKEILGKYIDLIRNSLEFGRGKLVSTGFANGIAGITYFLWCFLELFDNPGVKKIAEWGMSCLEERFFNDKGYCGWFTDNSKREASCSYDVGTAGILMCYLKAYEVSGDSSYKVMAVRALDSLPVFERNSTFEYASGAAGLGDMYLEAWKVLRDVKYFERAENLAQLLIYTCKVNPEGGRGWYTVNNELLTAELLNGNAGCLYFLARFSFENSLPSLFGCR